MPGGDYTEDSDVDIMILVDMPEEKSAGAGESLSGLTYDFNEAHDLKIMPVVIGEKAVCLLAARNIRFTRI